MKFMQTSFFKFYYFSIILIEHSSVIKTTVLCYDQPRSRKLSLLFDPAQSDQQPLDVRFYCPQQHYATGVEDLCYHIYPFKKTHKSAEEVCRKVSHRLAELDSPAALLGIQTALDTFDKSQGGRSEQQQQQLNRRFHLGSVLKRLDKDNPQQAILYWNQSGRPVDPAYLCHNASTLRLAVNFGFGCVELLVNEASYVSRDGQRQCIKPVDCGTVRYSVCEWRGHELPAFGLELTRQLVNAYVSVLAVMVVFSAVWMLLYVWHEWRMQGEIDEPLRAYRDELELFD
jgi:hypothetical protein